MTWWVIVNPWSGKRGQVEARARGALDAAGIEYEHRVSASAEHIADLITEGRAAGATRFAVVGGDGTAHLALNALMPESWDTPPTLAILPAGSGSDFIRTFALPRDLEASVRLLSSDDVYRSDIGVLEGSFGKRYFLNVADIGVAAASVRVGDKLPRWLGGMRYRAGFWLALGRFRPTEIEVETDRRTISGNALNVVVANGQFFGGGLNIAPQAAVMDGLFDIQVFAGPRRRAFSIMPRVTRGHHLRHAAVTRTTSAAFELRCPPDWPIEADGELVGVGSVRGRVLPGMIDFKI